MSKKPAIDPYKTLGIPRDADDETIKRAYRDQAKQTHPDAGGSSDEFQKTQTAFMVLSNHDKRSQYDRTGKIDESEPDTAFSAAIGIIIASLLQAGQQVENAQRNIEAAPLFNMVRKQIKDQLAEFKARYDACEKVIDKMRKIASRIKAKNKSKPNFLQRAMEQHANERAKELDTLQSHIDHHNAALAFLDDYDFEQLMEQAPDDFQTLARLAMGTFGAGNFRPF